MEADERQAWRNVKMGIDTFDEERTVKSTSRGAQGGSSGEEKEEGSRSVSQSVSQEEWFINIRRFKDQEDETYTRRQEEEDKPGASYSVTKEQRIYKPEN
jgi:hypothetical protein